MLEINFYSDLQTGQSIKVSVGLMHFGTGRPQEKMELTLKEGEVRNIFIDRLTR